MQHNQLVSTFREFCALVRYPRTRRVRRCERRIVEMAELLKRSGFHESEVVLVVDVEDPPKTQAMPRCVVPKVRH